MAGVETTGEKTVQPSLVMQGISKRFGATAALDAVSFSVRPGEVHAIVGENGAGKSTLMKVLSGAYLPDSGSMRLFGRRYRPRVPLDARRAGVAMIYQELSLAPHLSVEHNITLGVEPSTCGLVRGREVRRLAVDALAQLGHPEIGPDDKVGSLSNAARQLVEIARALAMGCRILILDEPTSSLTREDGTRLFALLDRLREQGMSIVYISHAIEEVQRIADRLTVLRDGRVAGQPDPGSVTAGQIVELMVGREISNFYPRSQRTAGEPILTVHNLAGVINPRSAALTLRRGEVVGIAGLVGAGRTELMRALFGLDPVRRGEIRLGAYAGPASPSARWRQGAGMLSEDRTNEGLAIAMSVADNVTLSKLSGFGPGGLLLPGRQMAAAGRWIRRLGIRCRGGNQPVADLSGGNQQKVALARLLHHDVDVLLLDEPTRGIDVGSKVQIYELIDRLAGNADSSQRPRAVLMVSSYLPELLGVCDRIAVMRRGVLGVARPVAELDEHRLMMEATGQDLAA